MKKKLAIGEAYSIIHGDHQDWELVETWRAGHRRLPIGREGVFKYKPEETFWKFGWDGGLAEEQDMSPADVFGYQEPEATEVVRVDVETKSWIPKE